jgi:hypothetical protein
MTPNLMETTFWQKIQKIDTRILYVVLLVFVTLPQIFRNFTLPIIPAAQSQAAYDTIEMVGHEPNLKPALVDSTWSASTRGENEWQTRALIEHMMMMHIRFIVLPGDPQAPQLMGQIVDDLKKKYGYQYGRDYIIIHYLQSTAYTQILKGMARSIPEALGTDEYGRDVRSFPLMKNVNNFSDISLLVEITPTESYAKWLQFLQGSKKIPIVVAATAVESPEIFPYLDSHQVQGLLVGVKGAGDYESLMKIKRGGTAVSTSLSLVYALIILLIIIGNVGYFAEKRANGTVRSNIR